MGQSASLYRISKSDFPKIIENPNDFGLFKLTKGYEIFDQSFDGLQFVLEKGLDDKSRNLIKTIFNPSAFVGELIDFSKIDFDNLPDDINLEQQPVYYNDPNKVSEINQLLDSISIQKFQDNFDHADLNNNDVYPAKCWNEQTEDNIAFNVRHLTVEFQHLKTIFNAASENGEYLLCYGG